MTRATMHGDHEESRIPTEQFEGLPEQSKPCPPQSEQVRNRAVRVPPKNAYGETRITATLKLRTTLANDRTAKLDTTEPTLVQRRAFC
eukprot:4417878-Amphidinium_carterae.1